MKTPEQLMIPRIMCTAPFLGMERYDWKVGGIMTVEDNFSLRKEALSLPDLYPTTFRLLQWWEERPVEDMPEYVKFYDEDGNLDFVLKVERYITHRETTAFWAFEYLWDNEPSIRRMSLNG